MLFVVVLVVLVVVLRLISPPTPRRSSADLWSGYYERSAADIAADAKRSAEMARFLAAPKPRPVRPTAMRWRPETDSYLLRWPDTGCEVWTSGVRIAAEKMDPIYPPDSWLARQREQP